MVSKSSQLIRHDICRQELQDLGATVMDISDIMTYVVFELGETTIAYLYNLNPDHTFHFERIKPYTMEIGIYDTEEQIVDVIKVDIEQFKNAMHSKNFERFVEIDSLISKTVRTFEDLYLYYNLSPESITKLSKEVEDILNTIKKIKNSSERVYFKSDPMSFK